MKSEGNNCDSLENSVKLAFMQNTLSFPRLFWRWLLSVWSEMLFSVCSCSWDIWTAGRTSRSEESLWSPALFHYIIQQVMANAVCSFTDSALCTAVTHLSLQEDTSTSLIWSTLPVMWTSPRRCPLRSDCVMGPLLLLMLWRECVRRYHPSLECVFICSFHLFKNCSYCYAPFIWSLHFLKF